METNQVIAGLIAGPASSLILGVVKALGQWKSSRWKKSFVYLLTLVVCAVASLVTTLITGADKDAGSLTEVFAVAVASSQLTFRMVKAGFPEGL